MTEEHTVEIDRHVQFEFSTTQRLDADKLFCFMFR